MLSREPLEVPLASFLGGWRDTTDSYQSLHSMLHLLNSTLIFGWPVPGQCLRTLRLGQLADALNLL